jgi:pyruvate dehydrogenase E1 component alpha subunit
MDSQTLLVLYERMLLIRFFEERLASLFDRNLIGGTSHLCIGQEASAVGVVSGCRPDDWIVSSHRGHGHLLARGLEPRRLLAELLGRRSGYCGGKGGSQHLCSLADSVLGTNGITGGGLPLAAGAALAAQMRGEERIAIAFFGDGATAQGTFHETLNLAALWKLPVLFVCENNGYAMSMPSAAVVAGDDIAGRAAGYGLRGMLADGMDVEAVQAAAEEAQASVRAGAGPVLLELETYRHCGHSRNDRRLYRTRDEETRWREADGIARTAAVLRSRQVPESEIAAAGHRAMLLIDEAEAFALASPAGDAEFAGGGVYA